MNITIIDGLESITGVGDTAVQKIVADITSRSGLDDTWAGMDADERVKAVIAWKRIISDVVSHSVLSPEDTAMLQALYSRSPALVADHLMKVRQVGSGKFMDRYYRGYGHASIGDCGTTSIFIEDVPMLTAKAIQDWPLYSGQEASTRYMDFSNARISDPVGSVDSARIQSMWMDFYLRAQQPMLDHLRVTYLRAANEPDDVYERAIAARRFDVLRAFLPAGAHTNLSWHTNLRQASDHLAQLRRHPDWTVQVVANNIHDALRERYPSSFDTHEEITELVLWRKQLAHDTYEHPAFATGIAFRTDFDPELLVRYHALLALRPQRAVLPHYMGAIGTVRSAFLLDFGSFRDLQRHRNGVVRMPLLTPEEGFHGWYLEQMPASLREQAMDLLEDQIDAIRQLSTSDVLRQHYTALGFRVRCEVTQPLPAFLYRIELRTGQSVHPTLRRVAREEARAFAAEYSWIALHADMSEDTWDIRRGKQTLIEKGVTS